MTPVRRSLTRPDARVGEDGGGEVLPYEKRAQKPCCSTSRSLRDGERSRPALPIVCSARTTLSCSSSSCAVQFRTRRERTMAKQRRRAHNNSRLSAAAGAKPAEPQELASPPPAQAHVRKLQKRVRFLLPWFLTPDLPERFPGLVVD